MDQDLGRRLDQPVIRIFKLGHWPFHLVSTLAIVVSVAVHCVRACNCVCDRHCGLLIHFRDKPLPVDVAFKPNARCLAIPPHFRVNNSMCEEGSSIHFNGEQTAIS